MKYKSKFSESHLNYSKAHELMNLLIDFEEEVLKSGEDSIDFIGGVFDLLKKMSFGKNQIQDALKRWR